MARPFDGGNGPSHSSIDLIWAEAGAAQYLPEEGNKVARVLGRLKRLVDRADDPFNPQAATQLAQLDHTPVSQIKSIRSCGATWRAGRPGSNRCFVPLVSAEALYV